MESSITMEHPGVVDKLKSLFLNTTSPEKKEYLMQEDGRVVQAWGMEWIGVNGERCFVK